MPLACLLFLLPASLIDATRAKADQPPPASMYGFTLEQQYLNKQALGSGANAVYNQSQRANLLTPFTSRYNPEPSGFIEHDETNLESHTVSPFETFSRANQAAMQEAYVGSNAPVELQIKGLNSPVGSFNTNMTLSEPAISVSGRSTLVDMYEELARLARNRQIELAYRATQPGLQQEALAEMDLCISRSLMGVSLTSPLTGKIYPSAPTDGDYSKARENCESKTSIELFLKGRDGWVDDEEGESLAKVLFPEDTYKWIVQPFGDDHVTADIYETGSGSKFAVSAALRRDSTAPTFSLSKAWVDQVRTRKQDIDNKLTDYEQSGALLDVVADRNKLSETLASISPIPGVPLTKKVLDAAVFGYQKNRSREQLVQYLAVGMADSYARSICSEAENALNEAESNAIATRWEKERFRGKVDAVCGPWKQRGELSAVAAQQREALLALAQEDDKASGAFLSLPGNRSPITNQGGGAPFADIVKPKDGGPI